MSGTTAFTYRDRGVLRAATLSVTVPPTEEPVDLPTLKAHLRLDSDVTDALLTIYATTARSMVEQYLGRALVTQTMCWTVQEIDPRRTEALLWMPTTIDLPRAPVQSVTSVTTRDASGADTVLDPANYTLDSLITPARVRVVLGSVPDQIQHASVVFVAGYGAATAVPLQIKLAIMLTTAFLYENRGDVGAEIPKAAEWLCDPLRIHSFGS